MDTYFKKTKGLKTATPIKRPLPNIKTAPAQPPQPPTKYQQTQTQHQQIPTTPPKAKLRRPASPPRAPIKVRPPPTSCPKPKRKHVSIQELFASVHPLDHQESSSPIKSLTPISSPVKSKTPLNLTPTKSATPFNLTPIKSTPTTSTGIRDDHHSLGIKRLVLPATPPSTPKKQAPSSPSKITAGPLKGISTSLLDLIREKEAQNAILTPEDIHNRELLSTARQLFRVLIKIFAENRIAIRYDKIITHSVKALKDPSKEALITESLDFILKNFPDWLALIKVKGTQFVQQKYRYTLPQLLKAADRYQRDKIPSQSNKS